MADRSQQEKSWLRKTRPTRRTSLEARSPIAPWRLNRSWITASTEFESQLGVIDAQAAEDRRVEVVDVDGVFGDVVGEIIRLTEGETAADATSCHPHTEAARVVVAAVGFVGEFALAISRSAELAGPD